jgi:glycosyltransferase involved in cell wall biosynthesis
MNVPAQDVLLVGPYPDDPSLIRGGVQASVYGLARTLARRGDLRGIAVVSLPVGTATRMRFASHDGIAVTYLDAPFGFLASTIVRLGTVLKALGDMPRPVVHVHGTGLVQTVLMLVLRIRRTPFVWTLHGIAEKECLARFRARRTLANYARYQLYRFQERACLRIAPLIVVDTPYVHGAIATSNAVHVVPQGIFADELEAARAERRNENLVLSVGVMSARKGHLLTLEAFAKLRSRQPAAQLVIAGSLTDPAYHALLQARIEALGLSASVALHADLARRDIVRLLGQARVFALHSQEESQGIALCEALAAGVPVVATRVGGIPDIVADGRDGMLVAHGDVDAFAAAVERLLTDDALHAAMSQHARAAGAVFDWANIAGEIVHIYRAARGAALAAGATGHSGRQLGAASGIPD